MTDRRLNLLVPDPSLPDEEVETGPKKFKHNIPRMNVDDMREALGEAHVKAVMGS